MSYLCSPGVQGKKTRLTTKQLFLGQNGEMSATKFSSHSKRVCRRDSSKFWSGVIQMHHSATIEHLLNGCAWVSWNAGLSINAFSITAFTRASLASVRTVCNSNWMFGIGLSKLLQSLTFFVKQLWLHYKTDVSAAAGCIRAALDPDSQNSKLQVRGK